MTRCSAILLFLLLAAGGLAQVHNVSGTVKDSTANRAIEGALVIISNDYKLSDLTAANGKFHIPQVEGELEEIVIVKEGYETVVLPLDGRSKLSNLKIFMAPLHIDLQQVEVTDRQQEDIRAMRAVEGTGIYRGMKSEVIKPNEMTINTATNNSRQAYAKVAGLNIWESDGAGLQLGIGARGLSPNRTSHFNVRQGLYDISADALGYPESYYSPPLQGVERIELVRGAAALQYGTQFGGLLNFRMKTAPLHDGKEIVFEQSISSFGLNDPIAAPITSTNTFISVGFKKKHTAFYAFYQYKQGEGWRTRSDFEVNTAYVQFTQDLSEKWSIDLAFTHMDYLTQQPGGLTDAQFEKDPRQTTRYRNWFKVDWNILAVTVNFTPSPAWKVSSKTWGLLAKREALGFLGQTQREDPLGPRDLISGEFSNITNETRLLHRLAFNDDFLITSAGVRIYKGLSQTQQGVASSNYDPDFDFSAPGSSNFSDYEFPNANIAAYVQSIVPITKRWSVTPGVRFEHINTRAEGSYKVVLTDQVGNVIEDTTLTSKRERGRNFALFGLGSSYRWKTYEVYANAVQNYRAINFTDMQITNTSLVIDPNLEDERGCNFDLGFRGRHGKWRYDVSTFLLLYQDRIGEYFTRDELNRAVRYRSNVSNARSLGVELLVEWRIFDKTRGEKTTQLDLYLNGSYINAKYSDSQLSAFHNKRLEYVPEYMVRAGLQLKAGSVGASVQYSLVGEQYSDATNVGADPEFPTTPNAVDGIIPSYQVLDLSANWTKGRWRISCSVNNVLNRAYFTRRAAGYPGPGIIPSDGRSYHLGVRFRLI